MLGIESRFFFHGLFHEKSTFSSLASSVQKTLSRFDTAHLPEPLPWFSATASTVQTKARIFTAQVSPSLLYKHISQTVRLGRHRFDSRRQALILNRVVIILLV